MENIPIFKELLNRYCNMIKIFQQTKKYKRYNRLAMSEDRLTNALLNAGRDYASNIYLQSVINKFIVINSGRFIV